MLYFNKHRTIWRLITNLDKMIRIKNKFSRKNLKFRRLLNDIDTILTRVHSLYIRQPQIIVR